MRGTWAISVLTACTFTPGQATDPGAGNPGGGGGTGVDASPVVARPACDLSDSAVQLCLDFDTAQLGLDSSAGQHDAVVTSATPTMRATAEPAIAVDMSSSIHVAPTPALEISDAITYELWLAPTQLPASGHYSAFDNSNQYTIELEPDASVRCVLAGHYAQSKDPVATGANAWTHVACTYDRDTLKIFINGSVSACYQTSGAIATNGTAGTNIGQPFVGAIDNVHVLSRTASADEICAHAGQQDCNTSCD